MSYAGADAVREAIRILAGTTEPIADCLSPVGEFELSSRKDVGLRVFCVPLKQRIPDIPGLMQFLSGHFIQFCLSRAEIEAEVSACGSDDDLKMAAIQRLSARARNAFARVRVKKRASGECGELLLFVLLESVFEAPHLISKMALKTSAQMFVHGSDGVHVRFEEKDGSLTLFLGESKMYSDMRTGVRNALQSVAKGSQDEQMRFEIDLIRRNSLLELSALAPPMRSALLEYLNPYGAKARLRKDVFAIFVVFDQPLPSFDGLNADEASAHYAADLREQCGSVVVPAVEDLLAKSKLSHLDFEIILMPVNSVKDLRDSFEGLI